MTTPKPSETGLLAGLKKPGPRTRARIEAATQRTSARAPKVAIKVHEAESEHTVITPCHNDGRGFSHHLNDAFGTNSDAFTERMLAQLGGIVSSTGSKLDEMPTNAALAAVEGIAPQNEAEAMLAVQMVATNSAAMEMLRKAKFATTVPALQEYGSLATKLLRTYTAQMECLAKVRRRGEQKVTVEHVHVYPGGQAIVGIVTQRGGWEGGGAENGRQPHAAYGSPDGIAACANAPGAAVWSPDPIRDAVPVASSEGQTALPNARRSTRKRRPDGTG